MTEIAKTTEVFLLDVDNQKWTPLPAEMSWLGDDPIACTLVFGDDHERAWTFAFDLIRAISNNRPSGVGDVRFDLDSLEPNYFLLRLSSPDGQAVMRLRAVDVNAFVHAVISALGAQRKSDLVARSLDRELSAILKGTARPE
jgi:hypothetical protein